MIKWGDARSSEDIANAIVFTSPKWAGPVMPIEDEKYSVLVLTQALVNQGWLMEKRLVEHKAGAGKVFDSRGCVRRRWYLRALLHGVDRCVRLSTTHVMPSQQPQAFYRLLLLERGSSTLAQAWLKARAPVVVGAVSC